MVWSWKSLISRYLMEIRSRVTQFKITRHVPVSGRDEIGQLPFVRAAPPRTRVARIPPLGTNVLGEKAAGVPSSSRGGGEKGRKEKKKKKKKKKKQEEVNLQASVAVM